MAKNNKAEVEQDPAPTQAETPAPEKPKVRPFGVDRLRKLMNLSKEPSIDMLCDAAAHEIEELRNKG